MCCGVYGKYMAAIAQRPTREKWKHADIRFFYYIWSVTVSLGGRLIS